MKLTSASFLHDQPIPEQFAFGAPDPVLHVRLAAQSQSAPEMDAAHLPQPAAFAIDLRRSGCADEARRRQQGRPRRAGEPAARRFLSLGDRRHSRQTTTEIAAGDCSNGIVAGGKKELSGPAGSRQGVNDYTSWFASDADMTGTYRGYDGPCPPWNDMRVHRYHFTIYALSCERAPVEGDFTAPDALEGDRPHVLAEARSRARTR